MSDIVGNLEAKAVLYEFTELVLVIGVLSDHAHVDLIWNYSF